MCTTRTVPGALTFQARGLTTSGARSAVPVLINELRVLSVLE